MEKFSVKVDAQLVRELTISLSQAEGEGAVIAAGVENSKRRLAAQWPRVSEARREVKAAVKRLSDLTPAARKDAVLAALIAPLEVFVREAVDTLSEMEDWHEEEGRILLALEDKAATNRCLVAALGEALAACEVEGAESSPVDDTNGWSSRW